MEIGRGNKCTSDLDSLHHWQLFRLLIVAIHHGQQSSHFEMSKYLMKVVVPILRRL
jgi:hypothetical protein